MAKLPIDRTQPETANVEMRMVVEEGRRWWGGGGGGGSGSGGGAADACV